MSAEKSEKAWDVVTVGGGPAGMMAAGRAAERGLKVLLLEKNPHIGKKLLITGGGRCNVTNNKTNVRDMLAKYKESKDYLFSAFSQFAVAEAKTFFESRGMALKEENEGRLFPLSNKAASVRDVLEKYMKESGVEVRGNSTVASISHISNKENKYDISKQFVIRLKDKTEIVAKSCIVATGGTSHPETGSTGDGFKWLTKLGHTIVEPNFSLVPIALKDEWVKKLGGVTLSDVKLTTFLDQTNNDTTDNNKDTIEKNSNSIITAEKQEVYKGKLLFTHFGISGPTVLNMSRDVGELLQWGSVTIMLDLFPKQGSDILKKSLQEILVTESNKKIKNILGKLVPKAMVPALLELANIDGETFANSVRSEERTRLVQLLKNVPLHVESLLGADKAIVSSGGVALTEMDFKTMQSRVVSNLFIVGDVLNIDRPSGGYSLQLCWTTGYVAGNNC